MWCMLATKVSDQSFIGNCKLVNRFRWTPKTACGWHCWFIFLPTRRQVVIPESRTLIISPRYIYLNPREQISKRIYQYEELSMPHNLPEINFENWKPDQTDDWHQQLLFFTLCDIKNRQNLLKVTIMFFFLTNKLHNITVLVYNFIENIKIRRISPLKMPKFQRRTTSMTLKCENS